MLAKFLDSSYKTSKLCPTFKHNSIPIGAKSIHKGDDGWIGVRKSSEANRAAKCNVCPCLSP